MSGRGLPAQDTDRSRWVIVNGSDIERPTTSILLHGDDVVGITHLGMSALTFRLEDLIGLLSWRLPRSLVLF